MGSSPTADTLSPTGSPGVFFLHTWGRGQNRRGATGSLNAGEPATVSTMTAFAPKPQRGSGDEWRQNMPRAAPTVASLLRQNIRGGLRKEKRVAPALVWPPAKMSVANLWPECASLHLYNRRQWFRVRKWRWLQAATVGCKREDGPRCRSLR